MHQRQEAVAAEQEAKQNDVRDQALAQHDRTRRRGGGVPGGH